MKSRLAEEFSAGGFWFWGDILPFDRSQKLTVNILKERESVKGQVACQSKMPADLLE